MLDLANEFLHDGMPQRELRATLPQRTEAPAVLGRRSRRTSPQTLLALLAHPNIATKADVIRIYDHEVQGGTVVKPLTGR